MNINTVTFAAWDFLPRRGASDEHTPKWVCKERATKSGRKGPAARRVAPNLACGVVARRSQPRFGGMLPPRASPQAKLGATNVIVFMFMTTKRQHNRLGRNSPEVRCDSRSRKIVLPDLGCLTRRD